MDSSTQRVAWWREREFWLLLILASGMYFVRLGTLTIRGEESRWATVSRIMLESGDWIAPRQQFEVFPERPPFANWMIAISMAIFGSESAWVVRLPTAIWTVATVLLIYAYARGVLSKVGAFAAAAAYASMAQVMQIGRLAETESTFTFWLSASLLSWHAAYAARRSPWRMWMVAYACMSIAALSKGLQAPIYFGAGIGAFLLLRRDWKCLFHPAHFAGITLAGAIILAWHIPYMILAGHELAFKTWYQLAANRFDYSNSSVVIKHLVTYPFEILGCLAPWSVLLLAYGSREFRARLGAAREAVLFLAICAALAFPSVWISPYARGRYFMPMYPLMAVMIGVVVESAYSAAASVGLRRLWCWFQRGIAAGLFAMGIFILGISLSAIPVESLANSPWSQPLVLASLHVLAAGLIGWFIVRRSDRFAPSHAVRSIAAVALLLGLTYSNLVINALDESAEKIDSRVARLKQTLRGKSLVSFGPAHHLFVYHFGETFPLLSTFSDSISNAASPEDASGETAIEYFCMHVYGDNLPSIPFAWEKVEEISVDRTRRNVPREKMVIGRRISEVATLKPAEDSR